MYRLQRLPTTEEEVFQVVRWHSAGLISAWRLKQVISAYTWTQAIQRGPSTLSCIVLQTAVGGDRHLWFAPEEFLHFTVFSRDCHQWARHKFFRVIQLSLAQRQ